MCYNKNMEHSIDTVKQTPDTLPLSSVTKTYRLPEGMSLGPDESIKMKGFIARGGIDGKSAVLALDESEEHDVQVKNPETAYLVSNEEFDKKLDELGISLDRKSVV